MAGSMIFKVCCICNRVEHDGSWLYSNYLDEGAVASHGYCPQCFQKTMTEIEKFLAQNHEGSRVQPNHHGCAGCV